MNETLLLTHDAFLLHDTGYGHPERSDRLRAIWELLDKEPVAGTRVESAEPASLEAVARVHSAAHIEAMNALRGRRASIGAETIVSPGSIDAAWLAAGAGIEAVDAVCRGDATSCFALVRPVGHHAEASRAMGFCLFNNVAVAAAHARAVHHVSRVLIVDWDVHHGNGTQHMFESDAGVLFFSTHQFPFFPGTGAVEEAGTGEGRGFTINVPLPAGRRDDDYNAIFEELLAPVAESFRPELVLVSAGFDAHRDDPLGGMALSDRGFATLCATARRIAETHAGGKLVLVLEGGYDLAGLARGVHACVRVLTGDDPAAGADGPGKRGGAALKRALEVQREFWALP